MTLFDGINIAEHGMNVHRYRSEIAAQNIANVFTDGYRRKEVKLAPGRFRAQLDSARGGGPAGGARDSAAGAVRIASVESASGVPGDYRSQALLGTVEMMESKNAFELSMRAATTMKSMALSSLEIGRGS